MLSSRYAVWCLIHNGSSAPLYAFVVLDCLLFQACVTIANHNRGWPKFWAWNWVKGIFPNPSMAVLERGQMSFERGDLVQAVALLQKLRTVQDSCSINYRLAMSVLNKHISIWAGVCEQELVTTLVDWHIPIRALSYTEIRFLVVTSQLPFNGYKNISHCFLNMHSLDNASLNISPEY